MSPAGLAVMVALVFLSFPAAAQKRNARRKPAAGPAPTIVVKGNKNMTAAEIIALAGLKASPPPTAAELETAATKLRDSGFFTTDPSSPYEGVKVQRVTTGKTSQIVIEVRENPQVKSISLEGTGPVKPMEVAGKISTKPGSVFNRVTFKKDVEALLALFEDQGYQATIPEGLAVKEGVLTIPVKLAKLRNLTFVGLRRRTPDDLLSQMKSKPGDYYCISQLRQDLETLSQTGAFRELQPQFKFPEPGLVDVIITVSER